MIWRKSIFSDHSDQNFLQEVPSWVYITRVCGVGYLVICHFILFGANYCPCQHPPAWLILFTYFKDKRDGIGRQGRGSIANNGRSSTIADCLKILVGKKILEITKMINHFSHTRKVVLELPNRKDLFFSNFIIQLQLKLLPTIFHQIFIFHQMAALQKLWKMLFSFLRYLNFCIYVFPFFPCQPLL